jgi:hypothetical protein
LELLFALQGADFAYKEKAMKINELSLEQLENDFWGEPEFDSYVITACHKARKKPLSELSHEEIRLLIGQRIGLKYLLPMALDILEKEPLIEVTFYEGDLMNELIRLDISDWQDGEQLQRFKNLIKACCEMLRNSEDIKHEQMNIYIQ